MLIFADRCEMSVTPIPAARPLRTRSSKAPNMRGVAGPVPLRHESVGLIEEEMDRFTLGPLAPIEPLGERRHEAAGLGLGEP